VNQPSIADYAIIGDCRSAALVSRFGSIDWLCWPRFDSGSWFSALLDEDKGGRWRISPAQPFESHRRYRENSNVLETSFETATGAIRIHDAMSVASDDEPSGLQLPEHEIVRLVECTRGEVDVATVFEPRPRYATKPPRLRSRGKLGFWVDVGSHCLFLRTDAQLTAKGDSVLGRQRLRAGELLRFSLSFNSDAPAQLPPLENLHHTIERTDAWWKRWIRTVRYEGRYRAAMIRSALVLKLLTYGPSGAIVAAPTTSLPERLGGSFNWDYRYCWLRDASFTIRAMLALGHWAEASAFIGWLIHSTRLTRPRLRVLYDVFGNPIKRERVLPHLRGYRDSRPVRVGNAVQNQLQLDVYGEVIDAAVRVIRAGGSFDSDTRAMLRDFGAYVCTHWRDADEGIWEPRSGRVSHTHSRVLCWVALKGLLELHWKGHLGRHARIDDFREARDEIRREITTRCWNQQLQSYVVSPGSEEVDSSLLTLALYEFEPADSPRMRGTYERIRKTLGAGPALFLRNAELASQGDGAFGLCSFWAAQYLAEGGGTLAEAKQIFETTLGFANDVGLLAEEVDPRTGAPLGNFPQGFTHLGLINAALSIRQRELRGVAGDDRAAPPQVVPGVTA